MIYVCLGLGLYDYISIKHAMIIVTSELHSFSCKDIELDLWIRIKVGMLLRYACVMNGIPLSVHLIAGLHLDDCALTSLRISWIVVSIIL